MKKIIVSYLNFIDSLFLRNVNESNKIIFQIKRLLLPICLSIIFLTIISGICNRIFEIYKNNNDFVNAVDDYYEGNYNDAKINIEKSFINNKNQNSLEAYYIRGSINFKLNRDYDALKDLSIVSNSNSLKNMNEGYFFDVRKQLFFSSDRYYSEYKPPVFIETCLMKSKLKMKLKDYRGAIIDAWIAIDTLAKYQKRFNSDFVIEKYISLKYVIGCSNFKLKKFDNSLYCFNEIIKRKGEYSYPSVYVYKGILAQMKKDKDSACLCFSRAGELGDESAYKYINKWCK